MDQLKASPIPTLDEVRKQFEDWRAANKPRCRLPSQLWESAANLAKHYSIQKISKELRLNRASLKKHVEKAAIPPAEKESHPLSFVELSFPPCAGSGPECLVEMENRHGERMRIFFAGEKTLDLVSLGKAFWGREP